MFLGLVIFIFFFMHMSLNGFETLLTIIASHIGKRTTKFRDPAVQQIVLKLRYLAIGEFLQ